VAERQLPKLNVAGSIPVSRSIMFHACMARDTTHRRACQSLQTEQISLRKNGDHPLSKMVLRNLCAARCRRSHTSI
jgi:hypothetical protein